MAVITTVQPQLLSQMHERSVLRVLQLSGPCSRAEVTRRMGATAPTVSKAVATLLKSGLLEEFDAPEKSRGRPARQIRLASETAQVIGLVIDAGTCRLISAGMDGTPRTGSEIAFATPDSYHRLLDLVEQNVRKLAAQPGVQTLGLGISMPGLIDSRAGRGLLSPNVPITNGHVPADDLRERLNLETVLLQECHALCLAERHYRPAHSGGLAQASGRSRPKDANLHRSDSDAIRGNGPGENGITQGMTYGTAPPDILDNSPSDDQNDFAMLDATTGLGLAVFSGGRMLTGCGGLAGELGHLPMDRTGELCGCGRRGCLETLASDTALARLISRRTGRLLDMDGILRLASAGELSVMREVNQVMKYLALALTTAINLFNPSTLFIFSRMLDLDPALFDRLRDQVGGQALRPSFEHCRIERARGSKREGAIAGIIEHLTDSRVRDRSFDCNF